MRTVLMAISVLVLLTVGTVLWTYNALPGLQARPNPHEQKVCRPSDGGEYRFNIVAHQWQCRSGWNLTFGDAGLPGV
jgi:hypothetical protein